MVVAWGSLVMVVGRVLPTAHTLDATDIADS
jgi:hypothetical protein